MNDIKVTCINPACDDQTDHLWISLEKKIYHCWKCDYSGRIVDNKKILNILQEEFPVLHKHNGNNSSKGDQG